MLNEKGKIIIFQLIATINFVYVYLEFTTFPATVAFICDAKSVSPLYLYVSPLYLSLCLSPLSFYFSHLSLSSISVSPPLPSLFPDIKFPALDPSLATTHLCSRFSLMKKIEVNKHRSTRDFSTK